MRLLIVVALLLVGCASPKDQWVGTNVDGVSARCKYEADKAFAGQQLTISNMVDHGRLYNGCMTARGMRRRS